MAVENAPQVEAIAKFKLGKEFRCRVFRNEPEIIPVGDVPTTVHPGRLEVIDRRNGRVVASTPVDVSNTLFGVQKEEVDLWQQKGIELAQRSKR